MLLRGPYGTLYLGRDMASSRPCLVQRLYPHFRDERALAALQRDALLAAEAGHPAILAPQATGFDRDGSFYLISDVMECESLRALLAPGPLSTAQTLSTLESVCAALFAAAQVGLHHGRLSPVSILFTPKGGVLVTEFGLHHLGLPPTAESAAYLPPELYRGEQAGATAAGDVFALGAILHECLSGRRLFAGANVATVMFQVCVPPLPELSEEALAEGREQVVAIIRKACARDPAARYKDAASFLAAAHRALLKARPHPQKRQRQERRAAEVGPAASTGPRHTPVLPTLSAPASAAVRPAADETVPDHGAAAPGQDLIDLPERPSRLPLYIAIVAIVLLTLLILWLLHKGRA